MHLVHSRSWKRKGRETVVRGCVYLFLEARGYLKQQEPPNTGFLVLSSEKSSFH